MKKSVLKGILILLSITTITGCSNIGVQNVQNKTEFKVNEEAFVDHFQITCTKYEQIANTLKVNYIVTILSGKVTTMKLYFRNVERKHIQDILCGCYSVAKLNVFLTRIFKCIQIKLKPIFYC